MTGDCGLRFTHFGLFVQDVDRMAAFYKDVLSFVETDRGILNGREIVFLSRDPSEHHQIVFYKGLTAPPREEVVNQISFRVSDLESLLAFYPRVLASGADDVRPINHGNAWSVYFRDPEHNRVEVYATSPWYVSQPCREPLDISQSADRIRAVSEAWCRAQPSYRPAEEFREEIAAKIRAASSA
jgi:catechol-2,3-dioxygenase